MIKKIHLKKYIVFSYILVSFSSLAQQELNTITTGVPFLLINTDVQSSGMGETSLATSSNLNSISSNHAKLSFNNNKDGVSFTFFPWMNSIANGMYLGNATYFFDFGDRNTFSSSLKMFSLGNTIATDSLGNILDKYLAYESAIDASYYRAFSQHFSSSITLKYIYSHLTSKIAHPDFTDGQSIAADLSVFYKNSISNHLDFALGSKISNIGSKISYQKGAEGDFLPTNFNLGFSIKEKINDNHSIEFACDANKLLVPTPPIYEYDSLGNLIIASGKNPAVPVSVGIIQSFYDAPGGMQEEFHEINYSVGIEYFAFNKFALRAGYFYEHPTKGNRQFITMGGGINYKFVSFDVAYWLSTVTNSPLENAMKFSLAFNTDMLFSKKEKKA